MSKTISVVNYKGGVGKTSIALNLAAALNRQKKRVLLVDFDPQSALTFAVMGKKAPSVYGVHELFIGSEDPDLIKINEGFDLLPSTFELEQLERKRFDNKSSMLKEALREFKGYDFILIDTPPAVNILTVMAIMASNSVYAVVGSDFMSYRGLLAVEDVLKGLKVKRQKGIIVNLFDSRRNIEKDVFKSFRENYGSDMFKTSIRRSVLMPESIVLSKNIFQYRQKSNVAKDFESLAREVIRKEKTK